MYQGLKVAIYQLPIVGRLAHRSRLFLKRCVQPFSHSREYWEQRYAQGGTSGSGSYGRLAEFKAQVLNGIVAEHGIGSVIEWGCGDGNQLTLARYPRYLGMDISRTAIAQCRRRFAADATKSFAEVAAAAGTPATDGRQAELALSLDVIYHLIEDQAFESYMESLFDSATRFVVIYSSNREERAPLPHVRHRQFDTWISAHRPEWSLVRHIPNRYPQRHVCEPETSHADFYVYQNLAAVG